jgi:hypothetical protein
MRVYGFGEETRAPQLGRETRYTEEALLLALTVSSTQELVEAWPCCLI